MSDTTTISVPEDLADELYRRKARGESYADVIRRLLEEADAGRQENDIAASDLPAGGEGRREAAPSATNPGVEAGKTASTVTETGESVPADFDELVRLVGEETLPGSGEKLEARQEAFTAVVEYLREQGSATPQDFREEVYPDHPAMYTDGKNPPRSWWKNAMYPALRELAERATVIAQADTSGEWTWTG